MAKLVTAAIFASLISHGYAIKIAPPKGAKLGAIKDCGEGNYLMKLVSGNLPDSINIPSEVDVNMETQNTATLPTDLMCDLKLKKYAPYALDVPCLNGFGSCTYDGCKVMEKLCGTLPPDVPCKCPVPAGDYKFNNVKVKIPDMGTIMDKLMAGSYKGRIQFYSKANPSTIVGCFDMDFAFTAN